MSDRVSEFASDALERYPKEYMKAEFQAPAESPPYGAGWPGGFRVGAGALVFFFGAFLGFAALMLLAGPFGLFAAMAGMALAIVGLALLVWSGLSRYRGPSGLPDDAERIAHRRR